MPERLRQLLAPFTDNPPWEVAIELAVIWVVVFVIFRFVRGTRAAGALKGVLLVTIVGALLIRLFESAGLFARLTALSSSFLGLAAILIVVVFQPELRRAFIRLGEANFLSGGVSGAAEIVEPIVDACTFLSKNKFGAILAIERNTGLREAAETGVKLNAELSSRLLNSIFWPSSPLHDMGVVIRGTRVIAASVPFPLVEPAEMPDQRLGTRHRAAMGLARNTDALVVVVSEETGAISIADGRKLTRWLTPESLRKELTARLGGNEPPTSASGESVTDPQPTPDGQGDDDGAADELEHQLEAQADEAIKIDQHRRERKRA
ncbi:MAG: diadenylate cyclase CdaA [Planctomycetota bacterium]